MPDIILHHYPASPFSEKVRLMFGIKGLSWGSVVQPVIMPKPDLIPLTGGYRRIPVMQIGADVYCDSQVILAELERRYPSPSVVAGADWAVNLWADRIWFQASVAVIFGEIGESIPREFAEDREKLSGRPFDVAAMKAAAPFMKPQWRAYAAWLEDGLAKSEFLGGTKPSLADVAAWMNIWWTGAAAPAVAAGASPAAALDTDPNDPSGLKPGDAAVVQADDYGRDPMAGTVVAVTRDRVTLARDAGDLGTLHLHVPRVGYVLSRGSGRNT